MIGAVGFILLIVAHDGVVTPLVGIGSMGAVAAVLGSRRDSRAFCARSGFPCSQTGRMRPAAATSRMRRIGRHGDIGFWLEAAKAQPVITTQNPAMMAATERPGGVLFSSFQAMSMKKAIDAPARQPPR